jgi:hypothetical protein
MGQGGTKLLLTPGISGELSAKVNRLLDVILCLCGIESLASFYFCSMERAMRGDKKLRALCVHIVDCASQDAGVLDGSVYTADGSWTSTHEAIDAVAYYVWTKNSKAMSTQFRAGIEAAGIFASWE